MSRIDEIFQELRAAGRGGLMPFLTGGYPTLDDTRDAILGLGDAGADIVEIGFPFSDPIADGPVIASSMHSVLEAGLKIDSIFQMVGSVRDRTSMGLVAMVSESIIERIGPDSFMKRAAEVGFDGLIVPDMDISRAGPIMALADEQDLSLTFLIAPTTSSQRAANITNACRGFVYLLARAGLTGESTAAPDIERQVDMIRQHTDLPIAAGFGISSPDHVRLVNEHADAAIVGSALVRRMAEADKPATAAIEFTQELSGGLQAT